MRVGIESLPLLTGIAFPQILGENLILTYDKKNVFPQSGDYIHFRSIGGVGLVQDRSMYDSIPGADSIRAETNHLWNTAPGFDATDRVPSPWALVSGDVNAYIVRLVPDAKDGVPSDLTDPTALPITEVFTFDAFKDENDFFNMTFEQTPDGKYEFESDTYRSPGAPAVGGFYPAEEPPLEKGMKSEDKPVMLSERLPAAENKRRAEGPVFFCPDYNNQKTTTPEGLRTIHPTEGVALSDLICSGPGWEGGIDCEGLFAAGGEFKETEQAGVLIRKNLKVSFEGDGWGWGCQQMAPIGWTFYTENSL